MEKSQPSRATSPQFHFHTVASLKKMVLLHGTDFNYFRSKRKHDVKGVAALFCGVGHEKAISKTQKPRQGECPTLNPYSYKVEKEASFAMGSASQDNPLQNCAIAYGQRHIQVGRVWGRCPLACQSQNSLVCTYA